MTKKLHYWLSYFIGFLFLFLACLGDFTHLGGYKDFPPRPWERFDPALALRTDSVEALLLEAKDRTPNFESISDEEKMLLLYGSVIDRFTHGEPAKHTLLSNWLMYGLGKIHPAFGTIMSPELFLAKGNSLVCSQSSYLLMHMALHEGIRARHVGLNGHVVMEAWHENDWHMFDPDAEVVPRSENHQILSLDDLAKNLDVLHELYPPALGIHGSTIASREDNSFVSHPKAAYFEWKAQALLHLENILQFMKYFLPILLIMISIHRHLMSGGGYWIASLDVGSRM